MLKLINNSVGAANAAAVAEALLLADATGVDLDALVAGRRRRLRRLGPARAEVRRRCASTTTRPLFKTAHMLKDVRLCLEEAQAAGVPVPGGRPRAGPAGGDDGTRPRRRRLCGDDRGRRGARRSATVSDAAALLGLARRPKKPRDLQGIWDFRSGFVSLTRRQRLPEGDARGSGPDVPPHLVRLLPCQLLSKNGPSPSAPSPKESSS